MEEMEYIVTIQHGDSRSGRDYFSLSGPWTIKNLRVMLDVIEKEVTPMLEKQMEDKLTPSKKEERV